MIEPSKFLLKNIFTKKKVLVMKVSTTQGICVPCRDDAVTGPQADYAYSC